ncbi:hypothetical protein D3C84_1219700 [compost metagenome]
MVLERFADNFQVKCQDEDEPWPVQQLFQAHQYAGDQFGVNAVEVVDKYQHLNRMQLSLQSTQIFGTCF